MHFLSLDQDTGFLFWYGENHLKIEIKQICYVNISVFQEIIIDKTYYN